jgi:UDP-GlcNAc:undecaprenyl-phosphate GlcNAc-1-phosphate transferase
MAMYVAFTVAVIGAQFLPVVRTDDKEVIRLFGLLIGGAFLFVVGILDDRYDFSALPQYVAQLLAAGIAVLFLIFIEGFNNPLTGKLTPAWPFAVTVTLTLFWLGFMMNTINWLDGLDGLAAGVCSVAALIIFIHAAFRLDQTSVSLLPLALFGATLGFLPYNFPPARIFMGDSGAYFLGLVLAMLAIYSGAKLATAALVLGVPIVDSIWVALRRVAHRSSPFQPDRQHFHHLLLDAGFTQRQAVTLLYLVVAGFGVVALLIGSFSKLVALLALVALMSVATIGLLKRGRHGA